MKKKLLQGCVKLIIFNILVHTFTKLILSSSKKKTCLVLSPMGHYYVLILLIFALSNFMCSETSDFAFKCDSKVPGGI